MKIGMIHVFTTREDDVFTTREVQKVTWQRKDYLFLRREDYVFTTSRGVTSSNKSESGTSIQKSLCLFYHTSSLACQKKNMPKLEANRIPILALLVVKASANSEEITTLRFSSGTEISRMPKHAKTGRGANRILTAKTGRGANRIEVQKVTWHAT